MTEQTQAEEGEVRLVAMRLDPDDLWLEPVAVNHVEAWENGVTEAEALAAANASRSVGVLKIAATARLNTERAARKLFAAFPPERS